MRARQQSLQRLGRLVMVVVCAGAAATCAMRSSENRLPKVPPFPSDALAPKAKKLRYRVRLVHFKGGSGRPFLHGRHLLEVACRTDLCASAH